MSLWWQQNCEIQQFFVVLYCRPLSEALELSKEVSCVPRSSVHSNSSFMLVRTACVHVEAGAVAGQWRPLRLRLHCCPLVNDWAVGSCSSVYAVIKHSKPTGWQPAHFLAPGSRWRRTNVSCFVFPLNRIPHDKKGIRKHAWFWGQIQCRFSTQLFHPCFTGVTVNLTCWNYLHRIISLEVDIATDRLVLNAYNI